MNYTGKALTAHQNRFKYPGQRILANSLKEDNKKSGDLLYRSPDHRLTAVPFTGDKYHCISD
jgi:hypothetical protein